MIDNKTNSLHHTGTHTVTKTKVIASLSRNVLGVTYQVWAQEEAAPSTTPTRYDSNLCCVRPMFMVVKIVNIMNLISQDNF